jgi:hydrogenase/urease accessory protein HupE
VLSLPVAYPQILNLFSRLTGGKDIFISGLANMYEGIQNESLIICVGLLANLKQSALKDTLCLTVM